MTQERGIVCMFCGDGFGYAGEKPDDETMKAAVDHEKVCPENPYLKRIAELEIELRWYGHTIAGGGPISGYKKAGQEAEIRWYAVTLPFIEKKL